MKFLITLLIASFSCRSAYKTEQGNIDCESIKNEFVSTDFVSSDDKKAIPKKILRKLKKVDFEIVNPNESFNKTDMAGGINKRLIICGLNKSQTLGFIYYEEGGVGIQRICLIYKILDRQTIFKYIGLWANIKSVDDLKLDIKRGICYN
ncbi:MAG: hypothetical protein R3D58_10765 [Saprospiraceae bacterium]